MSAYCVVACKIGCENIPYLQNYFLMMRFFLGMKNQLVKYNSQKVVTSPMITLVCLTLQLQLFDCIQRTEGLFCINETKLFQCY